MATSKQTKEGGESQRDQSSGTGRTFIAPLDGKAHVSGDRSAPLIFKTIPALFAETALRYAERDAAIFVDQGRRFTWGQLADTVDALAAALLELGFRKRDRIGIWSPNRWEWLVTQYATARI